jgi:hypothetical protein
MMVWTSKDTLMLVLCIVAAVAGMPACLLLAVFDFSEPWEKRKESIRVGAWALVVLLPCLVALYFLGMRGPRW